MKKETFMAALTITDTRTGVTHRMTREFNFYPDAITSTDKLYQAFNMNYAPVGALEACGVVGATDMMNIRQDGNVGVVRVVRREVPYNKEQSFTDDQMYIVGVITIEVLE